MAQPSRLKYILAWVVWEVLYVVLTIAAIFILGFAFLEFYFIINFITGELIPLVKSFLSDTKIYSLLSVIKNYFTNTTDKNMDNEEIILRILIFIVAGFIAVVSYYWTYKKFFTSLNAKAGLPYIYVLNSSVMMLIIFFHAYELQVMGYSTQQLTTYITAGIVAWMIAAKYIRDISLEDDQQKHEVKLVQIV